ncbi:MAG: hypothetical protein A2V66_03675 [Ignavibacteria bacterium RBG_13_36_8]|nr:MAG: hypothetical protein A2V66_03675 [Ignavibacteria bacterium RBG_13_36_8]
MDTRDFYDDLFNNMIEGRGFKQSAVLSTDEDDYTVSVLFNNENALKKIFEIDWTGSNPFALIRESELYDAKQGDEIVIEDENEGSPFYIKEIQLNGKGAALIELSYDQT